MNFKVKPFAQLMLLSHDITLSYDEISGGQTAIDLYQIIEHPEIVTGKIEAYMKLAFEKALLNDVHRELYRRLLEAKNDDVFQEFLRKKNEYLRQGIVIK